MLGIRYVKYFPDLLFSLPGGLSIYKVKFATPGGIAGCLGGPWAGWADYANATHNLSPLDDLTAEARVYRAQDAVLRHSISSFSVPGKKSNMSETTEP